AMIGAVKSGQVDAMTMVPHVAVPLDKAGAAKIIGWVNELGPYQVTTVFTSTKNTTTKAALIKRFMTAYAKGIADYRAVMLDQNKDPAATEAMVRLLHTYEKAAPGIKAGAVYMNGGAALDIKNVEAQLKWFQSQKLAPASLKVDDLVAKGFAPIQ
ncbi:MAG: ABC transporter substrate-binding protein, partial [Beijerinckiaceae bacterium]|nr:ABC transporter substrate-binding protein [Beijerinckiaceae bacterium]